MEQMAQQHNQSPLMQPVALPLLLRMQTIVQRHPAATSVTVNPLPTVTLAAFAPKCSTDAAFSLTGGSPASGTYSGTGVSGGQSILQLQVLEHSRSLIPIQMQMGVQILQHKT